MAGFKALCLSGAELSMAMDGLPDLGILSLPELEWIISRITENCPLPIIVMPKTDLATTECIPYV